MVTASAGSGFQDTSRNVLKVRKGFLAAATTFCRMSAGGDELVWRAVSDTARQAGGDNLGVAVEEQNGQRPGDAPNPRWGGKWAGVEMRRGRRRGW